ncbi:MAG TPA: hypothetical protein PLO44_00305 [Candidatus Paceibacterota bacterium]|nr:hypothetical protein [Candidatus Paceibacterota bacterium]
MLQQNNHNIILPKYFDFVKKKGSSLALPANGLGGSRATSLLVAHFALQNTKFGSEKGKVQKPARIPPQTPPAGGKKAEAGQFHSPRKIVCPAESKLVFRIFVKKRSNFVQKTPPSFTFSEIERCCLGAKRLGMVFFRNFEGIFEIQNQSAVGNAEVRRAKHGQNEILQTNLFSFAFGERLSVFFFDCPKTNFKTIWTT